MAPDQHDLGDLVDRWATGFGLTRGIVVARADDGWRFDVEHASRRLEHVLVEPSPGALTAGLGRLVGTDDVWLRVIGGYDGVALPPGVVCRTAGDAFMVTTLTPTSYDGRAVVRVEGEQGERAHATVTVAGDVVATGLVAVHGSDATVDRVRTWEGHQRRGHAREVMAALQAWSSARGATRGLLVASDEGQHLYGGLGWQDVAPATTFSGG